MSSPVNTILAGMLDPEVFSRLDGKVPVDIFPKSSLEVYNTLRDAHAKYQRKLKPLEVYELHVAGMPMATEAAKTALREQYLALAGEQPYGADVAHELLLLAHAKHVSEQILTEAISIESNPKNYMEKLDVIAEIVERTKHVHIGGTDDSPYEMFDIDKIIEDSQVSEGVRIAIPQFETVNPVVPRSSFVVYSARPEVGKTSFHGSMVCLPGGFIDQGLRTHVYLNEESAKRVRTRYATIRCGLPFAELIADKQLVRDTVREMGEYVYMRDATELTMLDIERDIRDHQPDVVIIDLLDKVNLPGSFDRLDIKLESIYRRARDIGKMYNCVVFGGSQVSEAGEGRLILNQSMLKDSKTGKQGEADAIWMIGKQLPDPNATEPDSLRCINLAKDKINGRTGTHEYVSLDNQTGRYAP